MLEEVIPHLLVLGSVALVAFCLSFETNLLLRPWLAQYALARPSARSSHQVPPPRGGGLAVVTATLFTLWGALILLPRPEHDQTIALLTLTAIVWSCSGRGRRIKAPQSVKSV